MKKARPYNFSPFAIESTSPVSNPHAQKPAKCPQYGPRPAYPSDHADYVPPDRR